MSQLPLTGVEAKALRKALGLTQKEFWAKLGVTQSGGVRFESGRAIPKPVQLLFDHVYPAFAPGARPNATPAEATL